MCTQQQLARALKIREQNPGKPLVEIAALVNISDVDELHAAHRSAYGRAFDAPVPPPRNIVAGFEIVDAEPPVGAGSRADPRGVELANRLQPGNAIRNVPKALANSIRHLLKGRGFGAKLQKKEGGEHVDLYVLSELTAQQRDRGPRAAKKTAKKSASK